MKRNYIFAVITAFLLCSGCSKSFLEVNPTDSLGSSEIPRDANTLNAVMQGTYKKMMAYNGAGSTNHDDASFVSWLLRNDVRGLDLMIKRARSRWYAWDYEYDEASRLANDYHSRVIWQYAYDIIKSCNAIIEATKDNASETYKAFYGQALALRAMHYHNLIRMYQKAYRLNPDAPGIPLITAQPSGNFDVTQEAKGRGTVAGVYQQIVTDLNTAISTLTNARSNKGYINKQVAQGLLARVLCDMAYAGADNGYQNDLWDEVIQNCEDACTGCALMERERYTDGFNQSDNTDWIWGFVQDAQGNIGYPGFFSFYDQTSGRTGYQNVRIAKSFIDMFDDNDVRKLFERTPQSAEKDNEFYTTKLRDNSTRTGQIPLMRVSEMVLLQAEAYANKGDLDMAQQKLDDLRSKRIQGYTSESSAPSRNDMLERIWVERRKELYGEGFAAMDILRLGFIVNGAKATRSTYHGGYGLQNPEDNDYHYIYQIPVEELNANPYISETDQNP